MLHGVLLVVFFLAPCAAGLSSSVALIFADSAACDSADGVPLVVFLTRTAPSSTECTRACTDNQMNVPEACLSELAPGWPAAYLPVRKPSAADCLGDLTLAEKFVLTGACIPHAIDPISTGTPGAVIVRCTDEDMFTLDAFPDEECVLPRRRRRVETNDVAAEQFCGAGNYLYACPASQGSPKEESKAGARAGVVTIAIFLSLFGVAVVLVLIRARKK